MREWRIRDRNMCIHKGLRSTNCWRQSRTSQSAKTRRRPVAEIVTIRCELFQRIWPVPFTRINEVSNQKVFYFFNVGEAESLGRSDHPVEVECESDVLMPARYQSAT